MADSTPLTPEHLNDLNAVLSVGAAMKECLDKCVRAGLSVENFCQDCQQKIDLATKLKREFFPTEP